MTASPRSADSEMGATPTKPDMSHRWTVPPQVPQFPSFRERFPWIGGDLQTAGDFLFVPPVDIPSKTSERVSFPMEDGTGDVLQGLLEEPEEPRDPSLLVVVIHGLTGCEDSKYVRRSTAALVGAGYRVLRLSLRGAGPSLGLCKEQYHSGGSNDLRRIFDIILEQNLADRIAVMGYSLGGNLVLKGMAEYGSDYPIVAAIAVSAPIDLSVTARHFASPRNALYQHWLLKRMKAEASVLADQVSTEQIDRVLAATDVVAFDEAWTGPRNGYADAETYYADNASRPLLKDIRVPTLVIHGLNDPWIPAGMYEAYDWKANPWLTPLLRSVVVTWDFMRPAAEAGSIAVR